MARLHIVKKARKDKPEYDIKKGDTYYWWSFKSGYSSRKVISKTMPRRSQLTQSAFNATLWDIEDDLAAADASLPDDLESLVEEFKSRIEELRDEVENNLSNMPDSLQQGSTGEMMQERIDALDSWISDLESIDLSVDEDELNSEAMDELAPAAPDEKEPSTDSINELTQEKLMEKVAEILDEIKGTSSGL